MGLLLLPPLYPHCTALGHEFDRLGAIRLKVDQVRKPTFCLPPSSACDLLAALEPSPES